MKIVQRLRTASIALGLVFIAASAPASAEDLVFTLENQSNYNIHYFYASPYNVGSWEEDILGDDILPPDYSVDVTIADGREQCEYDFRFEIDNEIIVEKSAIDLCEVGHYTLHD